MLTIHAADLLVAGAGSPPVPGGAVLVSGAAVEAVGPYAELAAANPRARTRQWPGVLTPGLVHPAAGALLESAYHPDPREAAGLGTEPVTGEALAALAMDGARWGGGARRGLQRMFRYGVTAVVGPFHRPEIVTAVRRAGVARADRPAPEAAPPAPDPPPLDPLALLSPETAFSGRLAPGARADLAVFAVPADAPDPLAALAAEGGATCVATVLAGRLVHRRR